MKRLLPIFLLAFALTLRAQQPSGSDCGELRSTFEKWVAAYSRHDLPGTISIFADDVNFSFQGQPDATKADLEKSYREEFARQNQLSRWVPKFEEFQCSGDLGFVRSTWRLEIKRGNDDWQVKVQNRSIDILRRTPSGEWKIIRSLNYPVVAPKK